MKVPKTFLPKKDYENLEKLLQDGSGEKLIDYFSELVSQSFSECEDYDDILKSMRTILYAACDKLPRKSRNKRTIEIIIVSFAVGWYSFAKANPLIESSSSLRKEKKLEDFFTDIGYLFQELRDKYGRGRYSR